MIGGHKGPIMDLSFSPFHENVLGTASGDGSVKVWMIPDEGLTSNLTTSDCDAEMLGHTKKVMLMKWHPTAEFTIASASMDGTIKIWDVQNEACVFDYPNLASVPWAMDWNYDGSQLAAINKDKKMHVVDPRQLDTAMETQAHQGSKSQRV
jgi:coronin-1B/1C/6